MSLTIFEKILYFLMLPVVAIGAILSPLTNDTRIFYGTQYLAYKYFSFPHGISYVWEIKPIFSHLFNYCLVAFTCALVPFSNHFVQEIIIKTIAVCLALFASWIFSRNVLKIKYSFILCFVSLFACLNVNILQMEWLAVVLSMIACALFMESKSYWHYLSGALLILILLAKGTTGCLIISTICIVLIFQKKIDWIRGGIGFIVTGLLFFVASQTIWPEMLPDIYLAPILSHVGEYSMLSQVYVTAVATVISMGIYVPIVGLGLVYGGVWIKNHIHETRAKLLIIAWIAPLIVMWIQSESFPYQYFPFVLVAIVGLTLYEIDTPLERGKKYKRENVVAVSVVILFVMYLILYMPFYSYYGSQESRMNDYFNNQSEIINNKYDLLNESVLYLDTGSGPYYTNGANTSCRFVAPLILQRANPNRSVVRTLPQYWDAYNCTMTYENRYILTDGPLGKADGWFGIDTPEKINITNKIENEYDVVYTGAWNLYERKEN